MNEIPDNHFISYSVRIFGLSCNKINLAKLANCLNKHQEVIYVKINLKAPTNNFATDVLNLKTLGSKTLGTSINFLSIQGYKSGEPFHPEVSSLVDFIKHISVAEQK